jgi:hypothetical protein
MVALIARNTLTAPSLSGRVDELKVLAATVDDRADSGAA